MNSLSRRQMLLAIAVFAAVAYAFISGDHLTAFAVPFLLGALPASDGATTANMGPSGTFVKREDISDVLYASLAQENTLLGLLTVGDEFVDPELRWNEDSLNSQTVTDGTAGGQNATDATSFLALTAGQGASVMVGTVLVDEAQITAMPVAGPELVQVINVAGDTVTITRGFAATTKVTHAQSAVWRQVGPMLAEVSDLDKDISKVRAAASNVLSRFGLNVQISDEQIQRSLAGYTPGVPNELDYQLAQRLRELKRQVNNAVIYSRRFPAAGVTPGDYSTMQGLIGFLLPAAVDRANAAFIPDFVNADYATIYGDGADADWLVLGTTIARKVANLYSDRIRLTQSDTTRGWSVTMFDTDLGKTLRIVLDPFWPANAYALIDSSRLKLRPYINSFLYYRTSESFRDGEAARIISKMSLEARNTTSVAAGGAGRAHIMSVRVG